MAHLYKVILAEDHCMLRREIKRILLEIPGLKLAGEAGDGSDLFKLVKHQEPDLLLLDISLPQLRGMAGIRISKATRPEMKVLLMIMDNDQQYLTHAFSAGADGVVLKQDAATELPRAIQMMRQGKIYLPP